MQLDDPRLQPVLELLPTARKAAFESWAVAKQHHPRLATFDLSPPFLDDEIGHPANGVIAAIDAINGHLALMEQARAANDGSSLRLHITQFRWQVDRCRAEIDKLRASGAEDAFLADVLSQLADVFELADRAPKRNAGT